MNLLRKDPLSLLCLLILGSFAAAATLAQCEASNSMYSNNSPNSLAFKLLRTLVIESTNKAYSSSDPFIGSPNCITPFPPSAPISIEPPPLNPLLPPTTPILTEPPPFTPLLPPTTTPSTPIFTEPPPLTPFLPPSTPISIEPPPLTPIIPPSTTPSTPTIYIEPPPPSPSYYLPPLLPPYPPIYEPSPPSYVPSPPDYIPGPIGYLPAPPTFLPPVVYPPPSVPPPPSYNGEPSRLWCVAKPTVPDPILQEAMDFACGFGANCIPILPSGMCYQPDTVIAHASYAFNNYWQRRRVAGGTCDFDGTGMLVTVDPSYDGCNYNLN